MAEANLQRSLTDALAICDGGKTGSILDEYLTLARWVGQSESPFLSFHSVFHAGLSQHAQGDGGQQPVANDNGVDQVQRTFYLKVFNLILEKIPSFEERIAGFRQHPKKLKKLGKLMNAVLGAGRSEDISSLKEPILSYAGVYSPEGKLDPPINSSSSKADTRGLKHPQLARYLCPIQVLEDFDTDPAATIKDLEEGRIPFIADDFPAFMYAPDSFTVTDMQQGLLRHPFPVAVGRHILNGPSSVLKEGGTSRTAKPGQAQKNEYNKMTGRTIAYIMTQSFWGICTQHDWRMEEGEFVKEHFFNAIVDFFEGPEADHEWVEETLAWWTKEVFGPGSGNRKESATRTTPSAREALLAQRCAKNLRVADPDSSFTESAGPNTRAVQNATASRPQGNRNPANGQDPRTATSNSRSATSARTSYASSSSVAPMPRSSDSRSAHVSNSANSRSTNPSTLIPIFSRSHASAFRTQDIEALQRVMDDDRDMEVPHQEPRRHLWRREPSPVVDGNQDTEVLQQRERSITPIGLWSRSRLMRQVHGAPSQFNDINSPAHPSGHSATTFGAMQGADATASGARNNEAEESPLSEVNSNKRNTPSQQSCSPTPLHRQWPTALTAKGKGKQNVPLRQPSHSPTRRRSTTSREMTNRRGSGISAPPAKRRRRN